MKHYLLLFIILCTVLALSSCAEEEAPVLGEGILDIVPEYEEFVDSRISYFQEDAEKKDVGFCIHPYADRFDAYEISDSHHTLICEVCGEQLGEPEPHIIEKEEYDRIYLESEYDKNNPIILNATELFIHVYNCSVCGPVKYTAEKGIFSTWMLELRRQR